MPVSTWNSLSTEIVSKAGIESSWNHLRKSQCCPGWYVVLQPFCHQEESQEETEPVQRKGVGGQLREMQRNRAGIHRQIILETALFLGFQLLEPINLIIFKSI